MIVSFFLILPLGPLRAGSPKQGEYEAIDDEDEDIDDEREQANLLSSSGHSISSAKAQEALSSFTANLRRARGLFFP